MLKNKIEHRINKHYLLLVKPEERQCLKSRWYTNLIFAWILFFQTNEMRIFLSCRNESTEKTINVSNSWNWPKFYVSYKNLSCNFVSLTKSQILPFSGKLRKNWVVQTKATAKEMWRTKNWILGWRTFRQIPPASLWEAHAGLGTKILKIFKTLYNCSLNQVHEVNSILAIDPSLTSLLVKTKTRFLIFVRNSKH